MYRFAMSAAALPEPWRCCGARRRRGSRHCPGRTHGTAGSHRHVDRRKNGRLREAGRVPAALPGPAPGKAARRAAAGHDESAVRHHPTTGLGSNPIGIDRGSDGASHVVRFDRDGDRVLVVFENWSYRSSAASNAAHRRTVQEAFPPSTVAALPIVAAEGGRLLVDAGDLVMRDWNGVTETLASSRQGTYTLARDRSSSTGPTPRSFRQHGGRRRADVHDQRHPGSDRRSGGARGPRADAAAASNADAPA